MDAFASSGYTAGQLNATVKLLRRQGGKDGVELFLRGELEVSTKSPARPRLRTLRPVPVHTFKANDTFFAGPLRFSFSEDFARTFIGREEPASSEVLVPFELTGNTTSDSRIIADLGGERRAEVKLADVWTTLSLQPNGEGALLTDGRANNFYVDVGGALHVVTVFRGVAMKMWRLHVCSRGVTWTNDGCRFFARAA